MRWPNALSALLHLLAWTHYSLSTCSDPPISLPTPPTFFPPTLQRAAIYATEVMADRVLKSEGFKGHRHSDALDWSFGQVSTKC
jgi:hypothetical protein